MKKTLLLTLGLMVLPFSSFAMAQDRLSDESLEDRITQLQEQLEKLQSHIAEIQALKDLPEDQRADQWETLQTEQKAENEVRRGSIRAKARRGQNNTRRRSNRYGRRAQRAEENGQEERAERFQKRSSRLGRRYGTGLRRTRPNYRRTHQTRPIEETPNQDDLDEIFEELE